MSSWALGSVVDGYRLEAELGRGGMGAVFRATQLETGAEVAIKTLTTPDWEDAARLEREGEALARVRHPNLLRVHGSGRHGGQPYLVLQLAQGSLADRLAAGPMPWGEAYRLAQALAAGLAATHAAGILHRVLKPEIVRFDEEGTPLLADFGLARVEDQSRLTETGTLLGTPRYMAPEQARGEPLGPAADLYSLGALLFHCLSGRPPLSGRGGILAQLHALQEVQPPRVSTLAEVPPWLDELVAKCLAKDAAERPGLEAFREQGDEAAPGRGRLLWIVGVVVALAGAGAGAVSMRDESRPSPSASLPASATRAPAPTPPRSPVRGDGAPTRAELLAGMRAPFRVADREDPEALEALRKLRDPALAEEALANLRLKPEGRDRPEAMWRARRAARVLAERGYLGWVPVVFKDAEPEKGRALLARLGMGGSNDCLHSLRHNSKEDSKLTTRPYTEAVFLWPGTSLDTRRADAIALTKDRARGQPLPRGIGQAWARLWREERSESETPLLLRLRTPVQGGRAREALAGYLANWEAWRKDRDVAAEVARVAEWAWLRELAAAGHAYTVAKAPLTPRDLEAVGEEADEVFGYVDWGRGRYLRALMRWPEADFAVPPRPGQGPPPEVRALMLRDLDAALKLSPSLIVARLLRAQLRYEAGDVAGTFADLEAALVSSPQQRPRREVFVAYYRLRERAKANPPTWDKETSAAFDRAALFGASWKHDLRKARAKESARDVARLEIEVRLWRRLEALADGLR